MSIAVRAPVLVGTRVFVGERPTHDVRAILLLKVRMGFDESHETGEVLQEQKLGTTPKAMREVFGSTPRCRIALETGTHSPWVRFNLDCFPKA